jgi:hypothetical protein
MIKDCRATGAPPHPSFSATTRVVDRVAITTALGAPAQLSGPTSPGLRMDKRRADENVSYG